MDYGWLTPATADMPAIHIYNSILTAERFITEEVAYPTNNLNVIWPDDSNGDTSYFSPGDLMIHVTSASQWSEATAIHEYGHHHNHFYYSTPLPSPDYCDPAMNCDTNPPDDCGHCLWCSENQNDAWSEGWPDWLADVVTRDFPNRYTFDDGTPFTALFPLSHESPRTCNNTFQNPLTTEGFVAALLTDIEDETQDDHDDDPDVGTVSRDGVFDLMCLGIEEIFFVTYEREPTTVAAFIDAFRVEYPPHAADLWATAYNVGGDAYVSSFPEDTEPPGLVSGLFSPTHPVGIGGSLPCITFEFDAASDDVTGANRYSWVLTQNPAGEEPDEFIEFVRTTDRCRIEGTAPAPGLGEWYLSIKARDNSGSVPGGMTGTWSEQFATYGPFEILDCNNTGQMGICDIDCSHTGTFGGACSYIVSPCNALAECVESSTDCNGNLRPDECDINEGFSEDCDVNFIPDDCQEMKHFFTEADPPEGFDWGLSSNWEEGIIPQDGDSVCIPDDASVVTVVYKEEDTVLRNMGCFKNFIMAGAVFPAQFPRPDLDFDENSFIQGDFQMEGRSTLTVNDRLYIDGRFIWKDGDIHGNGVTEVGEGVSLSTSSVSLVNGELKLLSGDSFSSGPRIVLQSGADITIRPSATYTYEGDSAIFDGGSGLIDLDGALIRSAGDGTASVLTPIDNSGVIHVQTGELVLSRASTHTGDLLGDEGTTLGFGGNHTLTQSSTLVADTVEFISGTSMDHGTVNISDTINGTGAIWTFAEDANIISYGDHLYVERGRVNFLAPADASIDLQTITITTGGESSGQVDFNTGQPVNVEDFTMTKGTLWGPNPINVSGNFSWTNGSFRAGGAMTANGPVVFNATSSSRNLNRILNITDQAVFNSAFGMSSAGRVNIYPGVVVNMPFNSGGIGGGVFDNNGETVLRTSGDGEISISGKIINNGLFHNQTGTLSFATHALAGGSTYTGDILSDPGAILKFAGAGHDLQTPSTMTAESLVLSANSSTCHGSVDISDSIYCDGCAWTFAPDANIIDYGNDLRVERGVLRIESPTDRAISFDTVTIEVNFNGSSLYFDTGQPVNINTLRLLNGNSLLGGSSPINIADQFTWNNGNIFAGGTIISDGNTTINPTSNARTLSRPFINNGLMTFVGGFSLGGSGRIDNSSTGVIDFQYDFRTVTNRTINNAGMIMRTANDGTSLLQNVDINNSGTIDVQQGTLEITTALFTQTTGNTIINAGTTLDLSTSDPFALDGGSLIGTGSLIGDVENNGGEVMPGFSAGELTIDGDYTQGVSGSLHIEIGGVNDGMFDVLTVTGTANLAGALNVELIDGFVPDSTDSFVILTGSQVIGTFDSIVVPDNYEVIYNATNITINASAPSVDLNGDGLLDLHDFRLFQTCFSGVGNPPPGSCPVDVNADLDTDGDVDLDDYEILFVASKSTTID